MNQWQEWFDWFVTKDTLAWFFSGLGVAFLGAIGRSFLRIRKTSLTQLASMPTHKIDASVSRKISARGRFNARSKDNGTAIITTGDIVINNKEKIKEENDSKLELVDLFINEKTLI